MLSETVYSDSHVLRQESQLSALKRHMYVHLIQHKHRTHTSLSRMWVFHSTAHSICSCSSHSPARLMLSFGLLIACNLLVERIPSLSGPVTRGNLRSPEGEAEREEKCRMEGGQKKPGEIGGLGRQDMKVRRSRRPLQKGRRWLETSCWKGAYVRRLSTDSICMSNWNKCFLGCFIKGTITEKNLEFTSVRFSLKIQEKRFFP